MLEKQIAIENGLKLLSENQQVTFARYVRHVLPLDGFVFWVKASEIDLEVAPFTLSLTGSFHHSTNVDMLEDETAAQNQCVFTTQYEIAELNAVENNTLWIGNYDGVQFSFNSCGKFFQNGGVGTWHYRGLAVLPAFKEQFIDDITTFDDRQAADTSSLSFWLTTPTSVSLYPAFLVPQNLTPAYAAIAIDNPRTVSGGDYEDPLNGSFYRHVRDTVRITMYGLRHAEAQQLIRDFRLHSESTGIAGIANAPLIKDERRTQTEINALALKKTMLIECDYWQSDIKDLATRLLLSVGFTITQDYTPPTPDPNFSSAEQLDPDKIEYYAAVAQ